MICTHIESIDMDEQCSFYAQDSHVFPLFHIVYQHTLLEIERHSTNDKVFSSYSKEISRIMIRIVSDPKYLAPCMHLALTAVGNLHIGES